jgi:hypothetical protein
MKPADRLTPEQSRVLVALLHGSCLRVHRTPDGDKVFRLAAPDNACSEEIPGSVASALEQQGLVASNMKFPAATFLLTEKGQGLVTTWGDDAVLPLGPRNYYG